MAEKLGAEAEFQEAAWDSLLIGIDSGRFDTVINSVSITDERAEKYDFSDPYYYEARRVVVRADDDSIQTPENLKGKKIATNATNAFIRGMRRRAQRPLASTPALRLSTLCFPAAQTSSAPAYRC